MLSFLIFSILRLCLIRSVFVSRREEYVSVQGWRGLSGQHRHWHPYRHRLHHLLCSLPHVRIPSQVNLIKLCRVFPLILYSVNNSCSVIIQWLAYHDKKKNLDRDSSLIHRTVGISCSFMNCCLAMLMSSSAECALIAGTCLQFDLQ